MIGNSTFNIVIIILIIIVITNICLNYLYPTIPDMNTMYKFDCCTVDLPDIYVHSYDLRSTSKKSKSKSNNKQGKILS